MLRYFTKPKTSTLPYRKVKVSTKVIKIHSPWTIFWGISMPVPKFMAVYSMVDISVWTKVVGRLTGQPALTTCSRVLQLGVRWLTHWPRPRALKWVDFPLIIPFNNHISLTLPHKIFPPQLQRSRHFHAVHPYAALHLASHLTTGWLHL